MASKKAANPVDVYVGLRVRAARLEKQMSQETVAQGLHLSFQQNTKRAEIGNAAAEWLVAFAP